MNIKKNPFFLVGVTEFLAKVLSWLSLAIIPFVLSPEQYGEVVLYYSIIIFLIPVYLFGQDRLILRGDSHQELLNSIIFSCIIWTALSSIAYIIGYFWLSLAGLALALNKIYLTYFRANDKLGLYALNKIIYSTIRFILIFFVAKYFFTKENYIFSETICALILTSGALVYSARNFKKLKLNFKQRISHGFPLMIHGVSIFGIAVADRFFLEKYTGLNEVGNYSLLYLFASGLLFLYSIISIVKEKSIYNSPTNYILIMNIKQTLFLMFMLGILGAAASFSIYFLIFYTKILDGYKFLPFELILLLVSYLIMPIYLVCNYFLIQQRKNLLLLTSSLLSFLINIALNLILIPSFHIQGAVYATFISNILLCLIVVFISYKIYSANDSIIPPFK